MTFLVCLVGLMMMMPCSCEAADLLPETIAYRPDNSTEPAEPLFQSDHTHLTVIIPGEELYCFFLPIKKPEYQLMELNRNITGEKNITVEIKTGSDFNSLVVPPNQSKIRVPILGQLGDWEICLNNTISSKSQKVKMSIYLLDKTNSFTLNKEMYARERSQMKLAAAYSGIKDALILLEPRLNEMKKGQDGNYASDVQHLAHAKRLNWEVTMWIVISNVWILLLAGFVNYGVRRWVLADVR